MADTFYPWKEMAHGGHATQPFLARSQGNRILVDLQTESSEACPRSILYKSRSCHYQVADTSMLGTLGFQVALSTR